MSKPAVVSTNYLLQEIDSGLNGLILLIEYLTYLNKAGEGISVLGMEELLNMTYNHISGALEELKERQESLEVPHV